MIKDHKLSLRRTELSKTSFRSGRTVELRACLDIGGQLLIYLPMRRIRTRLAAFVAVVYALCVLAPPVALAFSDGKVAAHCLTGEHVHSAPSHEHSGVDHHHESSASHDGAGATDDAGSCCGLFCVVALPSTVYIQVEEPAQPVIPETVAKHLIGREAGLLFKPPIILSPI